ncbi:hypothetical protein NYE48_27640 [Paenibacillus sp. FSL M7-1455]|uniref:hypothetical protein n=1 Tax=Paenibacillus sp. FSL M7-1455 TaxID=2975316 RepID=UPI0030F55A35
MTTETKRDLVADLALCEAAITGPVEYFASIDSEYEYEVCRKDFLNTIIASVIDERDARMITEAYTGWPHAILRAMAAEEKWAKLRSIVVTNATGGRGEDINDYDIIRNIMDDIDAEVNDIANED